MDGTQFDRLARAFAVTRDRRWLLRWIPAGVIAATPLARDTSGAAAEGECASGLIYCRGFCADPMTDPIFCGSCDNTCTTGACAGGVCVSCEEIGKDSCPSGDGSFYCTDLMTDWANCGACAEGTSDHFCGSQLCVDGQCVSTVECEPGFTECRGRCVDLQNDVSHCGSCYGECYGGESQPGVCIEGQCVLCESLGLTWCNRQGTGVYAPYCANTSTDPENCGACENACASGVCRDGACTTGDGQPEPEPTGESTTEPMDDVELLQRLWSLERLSLELLRFGLDTFPRADFDALGKGARTNLGVQRIHEKAHVALLAGEIARLGGAGPVADRLDFTALKSASEVVTALEELKRLLVAAYAAALPALTDRDAIAALAPVLAVEGLHGGYLAALLGVTPFETAGVPPVDADAVAAFVGRFRAAS